MKDYCTNEGLLILGYMSITRIPESHNEKLHLHVMEQNIVSVYAKFYGFA